MINGPRMLGIIAAATMVSAMNSPPLIVGSEDLIRGRKRTRDIEPAQAPRLRQTKREKLKLRRRLRLSWGGSGGLHKPPAYKGSKAAKLASRKRRGPKPTKRIGVPAGWWIDEDGWIVRRQRQGEAPRIADTAGFAREGLITVRTARMAMAVDAGHPVPANWTDTGLVEGHPMPKGIASQLPRRFAGWILEQ